MWRAGWGEESSPPAASLLIGAMGEPVWPAGPPHLLSPAQTPPPHCLTAIGSLFCGILLCFFSPCRCCLHPFSGTHQHLSSLLSSSLFNSLLFSGPMKSLPWAEEGMTGTDPLFIQINFLNWDLHFELQKQKRLSPLLPFVLFFVASLKQPSFLDAEKG